MVRQIFQKCLAVLEPILHLVLVEDRSPIGECEAKLTFDDGHDSGLFTWDYLYQLSLRQEQLWTDYLEQLRAAGKSRDPAESVVKLML